jgi:hypothetical protein
MHRNILFGAGRKSCAGLSSSYRVDSRFGCHLSKPLKGGIPKSLLQLSPRRQRSGKAGANDMPYSTK